MLPIRVTIAISVLISYRNEGFFHLCKAIVVFEFEAILESEKLNFKILKNAILKQK
jgi:hypothetical protein